MTTTITKTATFIKDRSRDFVGTAELYRLEPPLVEEGWEIPNVIVSAVSSAFDTNRPETMVFEATEDGDIVSWASLGVVYECDIYAALADLGYEVVA